LEPPQDLLALPGGQQPHPAPLGQDPFHQPLGQGQAHAGALDVGLLGARNDDVVVQRNKVTAASGNGIGVTDDPNGLRAAPVADDSPGHDGKSTRSSTAPTPAPVTPGRCDLRRPR
jgi:hypothetical protein